MGALLDRSRYVFGPFDPKDLGIVSRPARRRNLDDADVVEGAEGRSKGEVRPKSLEEGGANRVGVTGLLHVDRIANRGLAATVRVDRPGIGDGNVPMRLAIRIEPPLDDLDTMYGAREEAEKRPPARRPIETAGLKCPPELKPTA